MGSPQVKASDEELLRYLLDQYDRMLQIFEHIRMDTPEDQELHDRAIATAREVVEPVRRALIR